MSCNNRKKPTANSSTTSKACPKRNSHGRRVSGIAYGLIHTAITPSTPRRYANGGSGQSDKGSLDRVVASPVRRHSDLARVTPAGCGTAVHSDRADDPGAQAYLAARDAEHDAHSAAHQHSYPPHSSAGSGHRSR